MPNQTSDMEIDNYKQNVFLIIKLPNPNEAEKCNIRLKY